MAYRTGESFHSDGKLRLRWRIGIQPRQRFPASGCPDDRVFREAKFYPNWGGSSPKLEHEQRDFSERERHGFVWGQWIGSSFAHNNDNLYRNRDGAGRQSQCLSGSDGDELRATASDHCVECQSQQYRAGRFVDPELDDL